MHYYGFKLRWANRRIHTSNVVLGEVLYEPTGECGPRVQRDYELVILHSGQCRVNVDDVSYQLRAGAVYLFLPGHREYFHFADDQQTHHSFCSVRPAFMHQALGRELRNAVSSVNGSETFRNLLATAFKLRPLQNGGGNIIIEQLALCLFAEYLNCARQSEFTLSDDQTVNRFVHHVEEHFGDADCLLRAHRAAQVSRNNLILKFRKQMQTTPSRYLWRMRVERGAAMLHETGHSIAEIAYHCGFKNPFHFSRMIKSHFGISPKTLRQQGWFPKAGNSPAGAAAQ